MKSKQEKRQEAIKRQKEFEELTTKQKILKLNLGGFNANKERNKLYNVLLDEVKTGQIPVGVGDSVQKEKKKPYQKPKKS